MDSVLGQDVQQLQEGVACPRLNKIYMLLQSCTKYGRTSSVAAGGLSIFFFLFRPFPMTSAAGACVTLHWEGRNGCLRALGAAWYPHRLSDQKAAIRAPLFGMKSPLYNMGDFICIFVGNAPCHAWQAPPKMFGVKVAP